jgi:predicted signal transduction protein with EAL and GGDEF domain
VRLLKLEPGAVLGRPFDTLLDAADAPLMQRRAQAARVSPDDAFSMEVQVRRGDGQAIWVAVHCSQYEDPDGGGQCLIYQLHDITSRHVAESRLNHIAYHDDLTGLANRHSFHRRLEAAVERTRLDPRTAVRRAVPGPRPLQAGQRQPGPWRRQRVAA